MAENQSKKQDKQHQIPMMVTDEVIRDFGIKPEEVTWRRIGNRKCRVSRLFLGDADGFSILYYQDVDSLVYWANQAAYRWKLRGMCMWSLGQEDMRLWEWLPKQI